MNRNEVRFIWHMLKKRKNRREDRQKRKGKERGEK